MGIAADLPLVSSVVKDAIEANREGAGGVVDWEAVNTDLTTRGLDENQILAAGTMVQSLQYGTSSTIPEAIQLTSDKLFSQYPGYDAWGEQVVTTGVSGFNSAVAGINYNRLYHGGGGGTTSSSTLPGDNRQVGTGAAARGPWVPNPS
jgi:hypothetical protein